MATLQELRGLFGNSDLMEKMEAAIIIGANNLLSGTPTADQQRWAADAFANPRAEAKKAMMAILASNAGASLAAIMGIIEDTSGDTDGTLLTKVNSVIPTLVVAHAGV